MFSTDPRLAPGDVIAIQYRVWRHDGCADEFIERWIRAEIIDCEPGTWPLARLTDGQHTEVRRFMIWPSGRQVERDQFATVGSIGVSNASRFASGPSVAFGHECCDYVVMALEIERKFRVADDRWKQGVANSRRLRQAYLTKNGRISIRIRIDGAEAATLTIKTAGPGIERHEYEYPIPVADAEALLPRREGTVIIKVRHVVPIGELVWEIDVFEDANAGLVIAEVELDRADQPFEPPAWLGEEVTHDRRFYNADLARHPFSRW